MANNYKILIIEDEEITRESTKEILELTGYTVYSAENGKKGIMLAEQHKPDLILLDIELPDINGMRVARKLKSQSSTSDILIIVVSSRDDDLEIVSGLETFADDYITKPFKPKMLNARMQAVLRRKKVEVMNNNSKRPSLFINDIEINPLACNIKVKGKTIKLTKTEFDIIYLLAGKPERVFSREDIIL